MKALKDFDTHEIIEEMARRGYYVTTIAERTEDKKQVLLNYMEHASEDRWCAGWLTDLETALLGDSAYESLVRELGGYWVWDGSAPSSRKFVEGFPTRD